MLLSHQTFIRLHSPSPLPQPSAPWLFGAISRLQAEFLLAAQGTPGCFLVRAVAGSVTDMCLSVLAPAGGPSFRHLLVAKTASGRYRILSLPEESEEFESLHHLVGFYCESELHFQDSGPSLKLTEPCRPH